MNEAIAKTTCYNWKACNRIVLPVHEMENSNRSSNRTMREQSKCKQSFHWGLALLFSIRCCSNSIENQNLIVRKAVITWFRFGECEPQHTALCFCEAQSVIWLLWVSTLMFVIKAPRCHCNNGTTFKRHCSGSIISHFGLKNRLVLLLWRFDVAFTAMHWQFQDCCDLAHIRKYGPLETIYAEDRGRLNDVFFVLSGVCTIVQCLKMRLREDLTHKLVDVEPIDSPSIRILERIQQPEVPSPNIRNSSPSKR